MKTGNSKHELNEKIALKTYTKQNQSLKEALFCKKNLFIS